jgi:thiosulfate/3-mercaptopyruvate sulfurtransferase
MAQESTSTVPLTHVFVEAERLLHRTDIVWLDARASTDYGRSHVSGAVSAPWQQFTTDAQSGLLVGTEELQRRIQALGVDASDTIVVYGAWDEAWGEEGRLFWMLEYAGHEDVHILRGGFEAWRAAGGTSDRVVPSPATGTFVIRPREGLRATIEEVAHAGSGVAILDTRTEDEYQGAMWYNEARGGHVPGAVHMAWQSFLAGASSPEAAHAVLAQAGISPDAPVIAYCTGGIRSGFVYAVLRAAGVQQVANYDGSWWEWAADTSLPVALPNP